MSAAGWRLAMAVREPDLAGRLLKVNGKVDIEPGPGEGMCQAWIPHRTGGRVIVRRSLRALLDTLDEIFPPGRQGGGNAGGPDG